MATETLNIIDSDTLEITTTNVLVISKKELEQKRIRLKKSLAKIDAKLDMLNGK